jgi:hypothetical protein
MKILVIPDIHNKVSKASHIFSTETDYDKVIFLGDYFDGFGDSAIEAQKVSLWLKHHLNNPKFVFLLGNHDVSYAFPNQHAPCSGYTDGKHEAIHSILTRHDWDKFKFFWCAAGWLFSHAGLHKSYVPADLKPTTNNIKEFLKAQSVEALHHLRHTNQEHWFYRYGDARTRHPRGCVGGLVWCDANEEFEAIENIPQIFGHTRQHVNFPKLLGDTHLNIIQNESVLNMEIKPQDKFNVCLDTGLHHYGVITDGVLRIKSV